MTVDDGIIGPGARFDRMEASLLRIETKLDAKVDGKEFAQALRRIELLETGETPLGKLLLDDFRTLKVRVDDLLMHGSQNAQGASRRVAALETEVARLTTKSEADMALITERRERGMTSYRWVVGAIGALSTLSAVVGTIQLFHG